jgi:hypothetical protein
MRRHDPAGFAFWALVLLVSAGAVCGIAHFLLCPGVPFAPVWRDEPPIEGF